MDFGWRFEVYPGLDIPPPDSPTASLKIPYSINSPSLTQVVTGDKFHYFKLRLYDINRFFQGKKSWNRDYAPAQQIYSDHPLALTLRAAIRAEHAVLYSNRDGRAGNNDGFLDRSSSAFFDIVEKYQNTKSIFSPIRSAAKGVTALFKPSTDTEKDNVSIYTYVVLDDSIRFSQSGAGVSVDMSSKHALHAGAATEVNYAGEFWIEYMYDGRKVLYMDNNSGTFAPPKKDLFRMKYLMEYNFPEIQIVVLDFQDPVWKLKRKKEE